MFSMPTRAAGRWLFALKPASWPKLLLPVLLGQAIAWRVRGDLDAYALLHALLFAAMLLAAIVLLNDWADRDVDRIKRRLVPEGSPKTIVDGILPAPVVLRVGLAAAVGTQLFGGLGAVLLGRPGAALLGLLGLGLFIAYSLPPLRLNYRGGGELLEAFGVAIALPLQGLLLQLGAARALSSLGLILPILLGFWGLAFASAVASGLSDERSDREGGKRTVVGALGNPAARRLLETALGLGAGIWLLSGALERLGLGLLFAIAAAAILLAHLRELRRFGARAGSDELEGQARYKRALHRGIARGTSMLALGLVAQALLQ